MAQMSEIIKTMPKYN